MNKYKNIAVDIVNTIGKDNIASATHCATRLRLQVKDREAIDDEKNSSDRRSERRIL
ncbi:PTS system beta-glucoside-specific transporter subunits IIABC [Raoultella terrigena]|uniref:PTS system beta-glucoside-specific transporter subunits IIABC n=1 Tax=Raoultella terrigena TaxID=577 RepID=A0A4U9CT97_RAOTE|nr:PTS system beta-glucoside-specific transporter subunits IIABC [Raoultella terrigena]